MRTATRPRSAWNAATEVLVTVLLADAWGHARPLSAGAATLQWAVLAILPFQV
jgi:hypothetical protein